MRCPGCSRIASSYHMWQLLPLALDGYSLGRVQMICHPHPSRQSLGTVPRNPHLDWLLMMKSPPRHPLHLLQPAAASQDLPMALGLESPEQALLTVTQLYCGCGSWLARHSALGRLAPYAAMLVACAGKCVGGSLPQIHQAAAPLNSSALAASKASRSCDPRCCLTKCWIAGMG